MNLLLLVMNSVVMMAIYFVVGLLRDGMGALYFRSISRQWEFSASSLAGAITLFDIIILATIAKQGWPIILAVSYAAGCGVGTLVAMRIRRGK